MKANLWHRHLGGIMLAMLATLLLTGCNTVSVSSFQYVGGPSFAPTDPAQVEVLRAMPARPHERLGQLTAEASGSGVTASQIALKLQTAAAKLGANAVVIISDGTQLTGAYVTGPWYGRTVQATSARVVVADAIRYTNK